MKLIHTLDHMTTTGEVMNKAIARCKELGWNHIHTGSEYTGIIVAWTDKDPDHYREMVVVDGVSETLVVSTTPGYTPANDPAILSKFNSFHVQHS